VRALVGVVGLVVLSASCGRNVARVDFDRAAVLLSASIPTMCDGSMIDDAMNVFLEALGADPALARAGKQMLVRIQADPTLTEALNSLLDEMVPGAARCRSVSLGVARCRLSAARR
jgi:hypothetical protein